MEKTFTTIGDITITYRDLSLDDNSATSKTHSLKT
jgi:hypothetical protein